MRKLLATIFILFATPFFVSAVTYNFPNEIDISYPTETVEGYTDIKITRNGTADFSLCTEAVGEPGFNIGSHAVDALNTSFFINKNTLQHVYGAGDIPNGAVITISRRITGDCETGEKDDFGTYQVDGDNLIDISNRTRIIELLPADIGTTTATTTSPVTFHLHAYLNPEDMTEPYGIEVSIENIDQNTIFREFSEDDFYLFRGNATTSGDFYYTATSTLSDGNYRIKACLTGQWYYFPNLFADFNQCVSNQFIVGEASFIGNISQTLYADTQAFFDEFGATSTAALANTCNPIGGNFNIATCMAWAFIPDAQRLRDDMEETRDELLTKAPWGYLNRVYTIFTSPATSTLPTFIATIPGGPGSGTIQTEQISFDMQDMIVGAGALVNSIEDPYHGKTARDIMEPFIKLVIALGVILTIVADLTKMYNHAEATSGRRQSTLA